MPTISFHAWKDYLECPRKYYLRYKEKLQSPVPQNEYFTLYGKLIEKFFQMYANVWHFKMPYMPPEEIRFKLARLYKDILATSTVDWTASFVKYSQDEIFEQAFNDTYTIMDSLNQNYFLSTQSEVSISVITNDAIISGRLDFVHKDPLSKLASIFDGKGTDKIGKNISNDQVLFYALLYYFHFKEMPVELGFFYYRFNQYVPVPVDMDILNEFRARLSSSISKMTKDIEFKANPCNKSCKYCDYESICLDCQKARADRRKKKDLGFPDDQEGLITIGF
jgi:CRISPR/Cas system-associated exonuclease Cas4 (RecB family)